MAALLWCGLVNPEATRRFYELVWPHRAAVLRIARIQTGNAEEADDLAQETLLKAFKSISSFHGTDAKAWLFTILRNARIDRLRTIAGSARTMSLQDLPAEPQSAVVNNEHLDAWQNPEDLLASFSDAEVIRALAEIPEQLRWTLLLVDVERLDHSEAAKILEVPVGTIKSRVHRGRALLRQALLPLARDRRLVSD